MNADTDKAWQSPDVIELLDDEEDVVVVRSPCAVDLPIKSVGKVPTAPQGTSKLPGPAAKGLLTSWLSGGSKQTVKGNAATVTTSSSSLHLSASVRPTSSRGASAQVGAGVKAVFVIDDLSYCSVDTPVDRYRPVENVCWRVSGLDGLASDAPFLHLARAFAAIEPVFGRIRIASMLINMFRGLLLLAPETVLPSIMLTIGQLGSAHDALVLSVGGATVSDAIVAAFGGSKARISSLYKSSGDLGDVAAEMWKSRPASLVKEKPLAIRDLWARISLMCAVRGAGAAARRKGEITALLRRCTAVEEVRYLVRFLIQNMRIHVTAVTAITALAQAVAYQEATGERLAGTAAAVTADAAAASDRRSGASASAGGSGSSSGSDSSGGAGSSKAPCSGDASDVSRLSSDVRSAMERAARAARRCLSECPDLGRLCSSLVSGGTPRMMAECRASVGIPLKPMLARITNSVDEAFERFCGVSIDADAADAAVASGAAAYAPSPSSSAAGSSAFASGTKSTSTALAPASALPVPPLVVPVPRAFTAEWKYDGQRAQIHYSAAGFATASASASLSATGAATGVGAGTGAGGRPAGQAATAATPAPPTDRRVRVFSRHMDNSTARWPDCVAAVRAAIDADATEAATAAASSAGSAISDTFAAAAGPGASGEATSSSSSTSGSTKFRRAGGLPAVTSFVIDAEIVAVRRSTSRHSDAAAATASTAPVILADASSSSGGGSSCSGAGHVDTCTGSAEPPASVVHSSLISADGSELDAHAGFDILPFQVLATRSRPAAVTGADSLFAGSSTSLTGAAAAAGAGAGKVAASTSGSAPRDIRSVFGGAGTGRTSASRSAERDGGKEVDATEISAACGRPGGELPASASDGAELLEEGLVRIADAQTDAQADEDVEVRPAMLQLSAGAGKQASAAGGDPAAGDAAAAASAASATSSPDGIAVCVLAFDLMVLNGQPLLHLSLRERRALLRQHFRIVPGAFSFARGIDIDLRPAAVAAAAVSADGTSTLSQAAAAMPPAGSEALAVVAPDDAEAAAAGRTQTAGAPSAAAWEAALSVARERLSEELHAAFHGSCEGLMIKLLDNEPGDMHPAVLSEGSAAAGASKRGRASEAAATEPGDSARSSKRSRLLTKIDAGGAATASAVDAIDLDSDSDHGDGSPPDDSESADGSDSGSDDENDFGDDDADEGRGAARGTQRQTAGPSKGGASSAERTGAARGRRRAASVAAARGTGRGRGSKAAASSSDVSSGRARGGKAGSGRKPAAGSSGTAVKSKVAAAAGAAARAASLVATYQPDVRSNAWLKLKRDYVEGLADSIDAVPIAAWHGNGRKAGWLSPFLLAVYDRRSGRWQSLCRVMSGFSDAFYKDVSEFFGRPENQVSEAEARRMYDTGEQPPIWLRPCEVWEIRGADLTMSPVHAAAAGLVHSARGISMRFPRFLRKRVQEEKSPTDASTPTFIAELYRAQARKLDGNVHGGSAAPAGAEDEDDGLPLIADLSEDDD